MVTSVWPSFSKNPAMSAKPAPLLLQMWSLSVSGHLLSLPPPLGMSGRPGLSSAGILGGHFSQKPTPQPMFPLVIFHPLTPPSPWLQILTFPCCVWSRGPTPAAVAPAPIRGSWTQSALLLFSGGCKFFSLTVFAPVCNPLPPKSRLDVLTGF